MSVDLTKGPIDPDAGEYQTMLCNLQGNILNPHRRSHAVHIFLKFTAGEAAVRDWMRAFADRYVTSAKQQHKDAGDKGNGITDKPFGNLFLSATGYRALGYTKGEIESRFPVDQEDQEQRLAILDFRTGMGCHANLLRDPSPETWEWAYRDRKIDAMILLAHAQEPQLLDQLCIVLGEVAAIAHVLAVELGHRLRNADRHSVEPFGYADGASQPVFLQDNSQPTPPAFDPSGWDPSDSSDKWTSAASLDLVLRRDPFAPPEQDCFGSYLVFRKLEQNIQGFHQSIRNLAVKLSCDAERAQALVLGRFRNGTPLAKSPTPSISSSIGGIPRPDIDSFDYHEDRGGDKCPFQAHVRRLNPRHESAVHRKKLATKVEIVKAERRHRIARRGIPYGTLPQDYLSGTPLDSYPLGELPTGGVGILFMCFQRSLSNQFGYLQAVLANSESRSAGTQVFVGPDPIIGRPPASQHATPTASRHKTLEGEVLPVQPLWSKKWDEEPSTPCAFQGFVTLKGGEFLFAPSRHFLLNL